MVVPLLIVIQFLIVERSNFIKFFIVFTLFFLFYKNFSVKKKSIFFICSILVLLFSIQFGDKSVNARYNLKYFFGDNANLDIRSLYLKTQYGEHHLTALQIFNNNLYFGVGNKNFRNECSKYQKILIEIKKTQGRGCATHPHQIYYEFFSEHGLIGFSVLLSCFLALIILNLKKIDYHNPVQLSCFFYIITVFLPILPSGSFFTSFGATIFWLNFSLFHNSNNLEYH